ncbi:MAG: YdcF family protein [Thermodesulfobacteriota bacterium]
MRALKLIKAFCYSFAATGLFFIYTPAANWMARPLVMEPHLRKADLIVVLGGGAYEDGSLSGASNERLLRGLLLYREGYASRVIFSGGTIPDAGSKLIHTLAGSTTSVMGVVESAVMERTAVGLGMPASDMAADVASTNTYENMVDVKEYMVKNGLGSCLLVTSATHMLRASLVAKKLGVDCSPAPVPDYSRYRKNGLERLALAREAAHEYMGILLYRLYGYI